MVVDLIQNADTTAYYWLQERLYARITIDEESTTDDIHLYLGPEIYATYHVRNFGNDVYGIIVDMTDIQRSRSGVSYIFVSAQNPSERWSLLVGVRGLADPEKMIIPKTVYTCVHPSAVVMPPSKVILPKWLNAPYTCAFEYYGGAHNDGEELFLTRTPHDVYQFSNGIIHITGVFDQLVVLDADNYDPVGSINAETPSDERTYAYIAWLPRSGYGIKAKPFEECLKMHTWEVHGLNTSVINEYSTEGTDEYSAYKGFEDGFSLVIDGLGAYDIWYYSDIITSSFVYLIAVDDKPYTTGGDAAQWPRLEVIEKNITIPNGHADGKIEVKCKFKHYDAIDYRL